MAAQKYNLLSDTNLKSQCKDIIELAKKVTKFSDFNSASLENAKLSGIVTMIDNLKLNI